MEQSDSEGEMEELTPHQMDLLVQLQELTGLEDLGVCRALLESQDWDLESVAREQLGMLPTPPEPEQDDNPAPPVAPVHQVWNLPRTYMGWLLYVISLPASLLTGGMGAMWAFVTSLVGLPPRPTSQVADPRGDVAAFCSDWEKSYGREHPPFNSGSYSQVLEEAKRELKFLLVYLHCEDHQDSERFCKEVLSNTAMVEQVAASNIIFWGCSVTRPEGYRVSQALRENTYPFLAMIVLRQNRMVVVGRREGMVQLENMVQWIQDTVTDYEAFIVAARAERDERNLDREIRSEQEQAFAETLRRDQEREQRAREQEEVERREEEERDRLRREELDRKDQIVRMKVELAGEIPEEPELGMEDTVRVVIKLPGGQRLERRLNIS